jgi:hypothetical protein
MTLSMNEYMEFANQPLTKPADSTGYFQTDLQPR